MQSILPRLVALGQPFPVPVSDRNVELMLEARKNSKGVVLCSGHLPFIQLALRRLVELGIPPTAAIANKWAVVDGRLPLWGMTETLPVLVPNKDTGVLVKARTILRNGGFVATLIDANPGDAMNSNIFRLLRSVGARLVFCTAEMQPDGQVIIEFILPPDPFCLNDKSTVANLQVLRERTSRMLQPSLWQPTTAILSFNEDISRTPGANLELDSSS